MTEMGCIERAGILSVPGITLLLGRLICRLMLLLCAIAIHVLLLLLLLRRLRWSRWWRRSLPKLLLLLLHRLLGAIEGHDTGLVERFRRVHVLRPI